MKSEKVNKFFVTLWSALWITIITGLSIGGAIWAISWVLKQIGVIG